MPSKRPKIVIAGQTPPPYGGQNIMIEKALAQFRQSDQCECIHLPFLFTSDFQRIRSVRLSKILELFRVVGRLLRIRWRGTIDVILYPVGGPQTVPIVRDILLLPWMLFFSRRVILHFHAAGLADRCGSRFGGPLCAIVGKIYRKAFAAVVMTNFNRRDPVGLGLSRVLVLPHRIRDELDQSMIDSTRGDHRRLLYVGHLCPDKGTEELLRAFASLSRRHAELSLELVGECLPPWSPLFVGGLLDQLGIRSRVILCGVLTGRQKAEAYARANLFVFPTKAPYESFGIVLAEAMMWKLPIVVSAWRGNADLVTGDFGGRLFAVKPSMQENLETALEEMLEHRAVWPDWGRTNRAIFANRYDESADRFWLVRPLIQSIPEHS